MLFGAVPNRQLDASLDAVARQQESHRIRRGLMCSLRGALFDVCSGNDETRKATEQEPRKRSGADFATAVQVGQGWNGFRQMTSMDVNGDNKADLVAIRTSDNTLWQWLGTGTGGFGTGTQVGSGWTGWDLAAN